MPEVSIGNVVAGIYDKSIGFEKTCQGRRFEFPGRAGIFQWFRLRIVKNAVRFVYIFVNFTRQHSFRGPCSSPKSQEKWLHYQNRSDKIRLFPPVLKRLGSVSVGFCGDGTFECVFGREGT